MGIAMGAVRRAVTPLWVAVVAVAVLLAGVSWGGWALLRHWQVDHASEQALGAAEAYVLKLTNLDADNIDQNFADLADGSTGEFRAMHAKSGPKLRKQIIDHKARSRGQIVESAVKSATRDRVVAVFVVNQSVSNTSSPDPVIDRSRIRMTMQKVDGRWLADKVELL